ncbi:MAG: hypothetical protein ACHP9Y_00210 [Gammaproteobacteria bacterium]
MTFVQSEQIASSPLPSNIEALKALALMVAQAGARDANSAVAFQAFSNVQDWSYGYHSYSNYVGLSLNSLGPQGQASKETLYLAFQTPEIYPRELAHIQFAIVIYLGAFGLGGSIYGETVSSRLQFSFNKELVDNLSLQKYNPSDFSGVSSELRALCYGQRVIALYSNIGNPCFYPSKGHNILINGSLKGPENGAPSFFPPIGLPVASPQPGSMSVIRAPR